MSLHVPNSVGAGITAARWGALRSLICDPAQVEGANSLHKIAPYRIYSPSWL